MESHGQPDCRIHQKIDIGMLASKLAMQQEEAERWIVDLIRGARLDAKIDPLVYPRARGPALVP